MLVVALLGMYVVCWLCVPVADASRNNACDLLVYISFGMQACCVSVCRHCYAGWLFHLYKETAC